MIIESIPGDTCARYTSSDGYVHGILSIGESGANILEWSSNRKGCTLAALIELKRTYKNLKAVGIGSEPTDPSWTYWLHMHNKKLVDELEDDDSNAVFVSQ